MNLDWPRNRSALVAALAVVAIVASAQTLFVPIGEDDPGDGTFQEEPDPLVDLESTVVGTEDVVTPFVGELILVLLGIIVVALLVHLATDVRSGVKVILGLALLIGLSFLVMYAFAGLGVEELAEEMGQDEDAQLIEFQEPFGHDEPEDAEGDAEPTAETVRVPTYAFVLVGMVGVLLIGAVAALVWARGDETSALEAEPEDDDVDDVTEAIGIAAGEIADRIEQEDAWSNEIYRSWFQLIQLLDVEEPRSKTPRDFAEAAIDAGILAEDVEELTELFQDVRYGAYEPTPEREQRAIETFREIERRYAPERAEDE